MIWLLVLLITTPQVKDLNDNIHKVYSKDGEIYYEVFDGERWSEPLNLSNSPYDSSYDPKIEIEGEIVTVEWREEHRGKVYKIRRRKLLSYPQWNLPHIIDELP